MYPHKKHCLTLLILSTLVACSDSNNSTNDIISTEDGMVNQTDPTGGTPIDGIDSADVAVLNGILIDSAVTGVAFSTDTQTGVTDNNGTFDYLAGEQITFSIGSLQFPSVAAQDVITPEDFAIGSDDPAATTTNIARLLQSLDLDGVPDNGIVVPPEAAQSAAPINFNVTQSVFEATPAVINLIANSGSVNTALVSADDANSHLNETLYGGDILLDLRNSVYVSGGSTTGCENRRSIYTLTYSQTGLATSRVTFETDADGACQRVEVVKAEQSFEALADQPEFLLTCGDGVCLDSEGQQSATLSADDPRNGCTDVNGAPIADSSFFSIDGPDALSYVQCENTNFNYEGFLLQ